MFSNAILNGAMHKMWHMVLGVIIWPTLRTMSLEIKFKSSTDSEAIIRVIVLMILSLQIDCNSGAVNHK